jgi:hypothetical protein
LACITGPCPVSADADPGIDGFGTACLPYSRISHQKDVCATDASHYYSHHCHRAAEVRGPPWSACITNQTRCDPSPLIRDLDGRARGASRRDLSSDYCSESAQLAMPCHIASHASHVIHAARWRRSARGSIFIRLPVVHFCYSGLTSLMLRRSRVHERPDGRESGRPFKT